MNQSRGSGGGVVLALVLVACGSSRSGGTGGGDHTGGGAATPSTSGSGGDATTGGSGGMGTGSSGAPASAGTGGVTGIGGAAAGGFGGAGSAGVPASAGTSGGPGTAGGFGMAGMSGGAGMAMVSLPALVTSAPGAYWNTDGALTESSDAADVTVDDTRPAQLWEGFGGAFNELGWSFLTSPEMQTLAAQLLFSATDGAHFVWGRIPMGANDYAVSRYTSDDTGADLAPDGSETNRPAADMLLDAFSLERDGAMVIPYIKAAQAVNPSIRFWGCPWTPPAWMKTGYKKNGASTEPAVMPSYFDGGSMKSDDATLAAYAQYFKNFVQGYRAQGIDIEVVSPQTEPTFEQNYPSCVWDKTTYARWIGGYLGPAMKSIDVGVMLGTLSNSNDNQDTELALAALADPMAASFFTVIGAQWGMLNPAKLAELDSALPIWATEHKGGNYPWLSSYVSTAAPNDQAYGVESWTEIRDAITKVGVSAYNAWNMVLDGYGWSIDTSREWAQDALLVADSGTVTPTPAYYVFRHISQYAAPGAHVIATTGGDAVAFENPDGSLVLVMFNSGTEKTMTVAMGGKKLRFVMPGSGWATVYQAARPSSAP